MHTATALRRSGAPPSHLGSTQRHGLRAAAAKTPSPILPTSARAQRVVTRFRDAAQVCVELPLATVTVCVVVHPMRALSVSGRTPHPSTPAQHPAQQAKDVDADAPSWRRHFHESDPPDESTGPTSLVQRAKESMRDSPIKVGRKKKKSVGRVLLGCGGWG